MNFLAWHQHGACHQHVAALDPNDFWPTDASKTTASAAALAICGTCPVQTDCLLHALTYPEPHGIWGGTLPATRTQFRRLLGITPSRPAHLPAARCGTESGYSNGVCPRTCLACRRAHADYNRNRKQAGAA